jgi:lysine 2,3-aminomutase
MHIIPFQKRIKLFRQQYFSNIKDAQWNSWKWQLQNRFKSGVALKQFYQCHTYDQKVITEAEQRFPLSITPYYLALISSTPLEKTVLPCHPENGNNARELCDPLLEQNDSPLPTLIHRYPDRVLFLTTQNCAVYCRYCTRSRMVGDNEQRVDQEDWDKNLQYIKKDKNIREVILSGGDPLLLEENQLDSLLGQIRKIEHVQIIRISSKIPVVLPQRITGRLAAMLKKYHPLFLSLHINHAEELNNVSQRAIDHLVDAGIVIASQTVLLKGVNNSIKAIKELMEKLLCFRIRPYALYQCDLVIGSEHFRTPLEQGLEIIEALREQTSGYTVPQFIIDPPGGKVALAPQTIIQKTKEGYWLKNWQGKSVFYPN